MSVAVHKAPDWRQWEGEIAGGEFPLEQFLGAGKKSAVFRTTVTSGGGTIMHGAIKLVPASSDRAGALVAQWTRASGLDHPHLLKILKAGTWEKAGLPMAYVVMEYADENLGAVLADRALTSDETLEMLSPVANALAFLHGRGFVHGELRPSNIFAVNDTLKISSDSLTALNGTGAPDLRAVAATAFEALTQQQLPSEPDARALAPCSSLCQEVIRNSAGWNGRSPWTAAQLVAWLKSPSVPDAAPTKPASRFRFPSLKPSHLTIGFIALVVLVVTVGAYMRRETTTTTSAVAVKPTVVSTPAPSAAPPVVAKAVVPVTPKPVAEKPAAPPEASPKPAPTATRPATQAASDGQVALQVLPEITDKARSTIHGTVVIVIRATADPSGEVTEASLQPTNSRYLGKLALAAAKKWKFAPSASPETWRLRFEITREETKVSPERAR